MSLKEISHRHRAIMRRLVTGQPQWEICIDLNISNHYLSNLKKDPLFADALEQLAQATDVKFLERLGDAKTILERLKVPAALKMQEMINSGKIGERLIKPDKQADMVVKMLALDKPNEGKDDLYRDLTEAVVHAYREKYHKDEKTVTEQPIQIEDEEFIDV